MKTFLSKIENQIREYKKYGYKVYSAEKISLGNDIINSFRVLQNYKAEIICGMEEENFQFLLNDLKELEELELRNVVIRKNINNESDVSVPLTKFGIRNIIGLSVKEFYDNYCFAISLERKYYYDTEILQIISLQQKIIEVMNDNVYFLLKKYGIDAVIGMKNGETQEIENELFLYSIKKLYSFDNNKGSLFSTYLTYELTNQKHIFMTKEMKQYGKEIDEEKISEYSNDSDDIITKKAKCFTIDNKLKTLFKNQLSEDEFNKVQCILDERLMDREIIFNEVLSKKVYKIMKDNRYI